MTTHAPRARGFSPADEEPSRGRKMSSTLPIRPAPCARSAFRRRGRRSDRATCEESCWHRSQRPVNAPTTIGLDCPPTRAPPHHSPRERTGDRLEPGGVPTVEGRDDDVTLTHRRCRENARSLMTSQHPLESSDGLAQILDSSCARSIASEELVRHHRHHANGAGYSVPVISKRAQRAPPHTNVSREPPRNRSALVTAIIPIAPSAGRASHHTPTNRNPDLDEPQGSLPHRLLAEGRRAASSAETNRTETSRSSQTTRLASSTARSMSEAGLARQIDRRHLGAHVKAGRPVFEETIEGG